MAAATDEAEVEHFVKEWVAASSRNLAKVGDPADYLDAPGMAYFFRLMLSAGALPQPMVANLTGLSQDWAMLDSFVEEAYAEATMGPDAGEGYAPYAARTGGKRIAPSMPSYNTGAQGKGAAQAPAAWKGGKPAGKGRFGGKGKVDDARAWPPA